MRRGEIRNWRIEAKYAGWWRIIEDTKAHLKIIVLLMLIMTVVVVVAAAAVISLLQNMGNAVLKYARILYVVKGTPSLYNLPSKFWMCLTLWRILENSCRLP
jgi:hypothetical protein